MNEKPHIWNLAIEVTRRCNIQCSHCLRGDMQNMDIPLEYIDMLLDQVGSINQFCPTGGEPSLNIKAIKYFIDGCKKRNISINWFYIATNGIHITPEFIGICNELHTMCKYSYLDSVQISNDFFHLNEYHYDDSLLKDLPYYTKRYIENELYDDKRIHHEGRAIVNYPTSSRYSTPHKGVTYLNVEGNIIDGCDWSYENQNSHILRNVNSISQYHLETIYNEPFK